MQVHSKELLVQLELGIFKNTNEVFIDMQATNPKSALPEMDAAPAFLKPVDSVLLKQLQRKIIKSWKCMFCTLLSKRKANILRHANRMHVDEVRNAIAQGLIDNATEAYLHLEEGFTDVDSSSFAASMLAMVDVELGGGTDPEIPLTMVKTEPMDMYATNDDY
jgi:hypothetical protein